MTDGRVPKAALLGGSMVLTIIGGLMPLGMVAHAADEVSVISSLSEVVINAAPLPGSGIPLADVPGNAQVLSAADLSRQGSASLTQALNSQLSSINTNDNLDDRFQPDILYRGFEASPVLGTPQGLAVYENGVRINEAFGNTVNWDLIPSLAINRVELVSSSAVYGLNALGGALSVDMQNGFTYRGAELDASGGSYGLRDFAAQYGMHSGILGFYMAGSALNSTGWREFSDDRLRNLYAVFSLHGSAGTLDLSYTRADNDLQGEGSAPMQELAVSRSLVFTGPQANINTLNFLTLNGTLALPEGWSLQAVLYYRDYAQTVQNGDTSDYTYCTTIDDALCQPDGVTPLTDAAGSPLPDISNGGSLYIGQNDFEVIHAWGRGATLQAADGSRFLGHDNRFTAGVALDYASTSFYSGTQIGLLNPQLVVLPSDLLVYTPENSDAAIDNGDPTPVSVDSVNKSLGAYVTDTFNVTKAIAVTASGRYNVAHVNLVDQLGDNLTGFNRFVHFNPSIGATYQLLPSMTLYGSYSVNNRTPTASEIECSNPEMPCLLPTNLASDPPNLRQVISHTTEIGLRGRIAPGGDSGDARLGWNLSVFRTVLHDDIYGIATSVSQGFFQNIGDTRREGLELGLNFQDQRWSVYANYSLVKATFLSSLLVPSPANPFQDDNGDIQVTPGDRLPGIPEHRVKLGADLEVLPQWSVGATVNVVSSFYYVGDEANVLAPIPGYTVVNLHTMYRPGRHLEIFASIDNLLNRKYATWGILGDPTGIGAPGVPVDADFGDPGVDPRFQSPAAPFEIFGGIRIRF